MEQVLPIVEAGRERGRDVLVLSDRMVASVLRSGSASVTVTVGANLQGESMHQIIGTCIAVQATSKCEGAFSYRCVHGTGKIKIVSL